jgi:hypothetical protein
MLIRLSVGNVEDRRLLGFALVLVMTFTTFTEEEWQAARSVRDDWPDGVDWPEVRQKIEARGRTYWVVTEGRKASDPPAKIRKRLERLIKKIRNLQIEAGLLPDYVLSRAPDSGLEPLDGAPDFSFKPQEQWLQDWLSNYENTDRAPFSGRSDPYRDLLYEWLLEQWVGPLGGELSWSRDLDQIPCGPLVDFLAVMLKAILGEAPGPHGIAKIIDQYK